MALRLPKIFDLYSDPFEIADHESSQYTQWRFERLLLLGSAQAYLAQFLTTFEDYPPRQKPGSFTIDGVLETPQEGGTGSN